MSSSGQTFHGTSRYELCRCLGKGGFGVVWEAFDRDQEHRVALKTLRKLNADALVSFKSEFRRLTGFVHPNLVRLYELTEAQGTWFFTMEIVDGVPFRGWVRPGFRSEKDSTFNLSFGSRELPAEPVPMRATDRQATAEAGPEGVLDETRLRDAFIQLVRGVSAMHAQGMVHRDIKPGNIIVAPSGRLVLLDFGLAAELAARRTGRGTLRIGTPSYMPPEVAAGRAHAEAGDWYSVGVVLYEALTGQVPFLGTPRTVLRRKTEVDAPNPLPLVKESVRDLAFIARDLLARDPTQRLTGEELRRRLGMKDVDILGREGEFVGREDELRELERLKGIAEAGGCAVAMVTGASGIGKSALVRRFVDGLTSGEVVLQGSCYERETVPFKALDEVVDDLSGWLSSLGRRVREAYIPEGAGLVAKLFPTLHRVVPKVQDPVADAVEIRRRAARALNEIVRRVGEDHLLVVEIDDIQWGDADSALLLELVLRERPPRMLLLTTCRATGLHAPVPALLRTLVEDKVLSGGEIPVTELSEAEARHLAESLLGGADTRVDALVAEAGGHPLFLDGLLRYAHDGAGGSIDSMIARHVRELPQETAQVMHLLSVATQPVPRRLVRRALGLKGDQAATSRLIVDRLVQTLDTTQGELLAPYHSRIGESVLGGLDELSLRLCHRQIADAMEHLGWGEVEQLFVHRKGAGERDRARALALEAAAHAEASLAYHRAAELYGEARSLGVEGWEVAEQEGSAWIAAGRPKDAADVLLVAAKAAPSPGSEELRRRAAEQLLAGGFADRGIELTKQVLAPLGLRLAPNPRWALASLLWQRLRLSWRGLEPRTGHTPGAEELFTVDTCWSLASGLAIIDTFVATDFQVRQLRFALDAGEPYRVGRALALEASFVAAQGGEASRQQFETLLHRADAYARELESVHLRALVPLCRAMCEFLCAGWAKAAQGMLEAETVLIRDCRDVTWELSQTTTFYADALHNLGRFEEMEAVVGARLASARARGNKQLTTFLQYLQASQVRLVQDLPEQGLEEIRELDHRSPYGFHYTDWWRAYGTSNLWLYRGDVTRAREVWESEWPALRGSMFLLIKVIGEPAHYQRALLHVAYAATLPHGIRRMVLLWRASRTARWLSRRSRWGQAMGASLDALISLARGERGEALATLERAEALHRELSMLAVVHACRFRQGEILGGERGADRCAAALEAMSALGARAPGRMVDFYLPVQVTPRPR